MILFVIHISHSSILKVCRIGRKSGNVRCVCFMWTITHVIGELVIFRVRIRSFCSLPSAGDYIKEEGGGGRGGGGAYIVTCLVSVENEVTQKKCSANLHRLS